MKNELATVIAAYLGFAQTVVATYFAKHYPNNTVAVLSTEAGRRYVRIVITSGSSRSCYGFIDITNGDLLKSASWKAPATNFARGNLYDSATWALCTGPHSIY